MWFVWRDVHVAVHGEAKQKENAQRRNCGDAEKLGETWA